MCHSPQRLNQIVTIIVTKQFPRIEEPRGACCVRALRASTNSSMLAKAWKEARVIGWRWQVTPYSGGR